MKKWHIVLWVVFASLAISGVSLIFWRSPKIDDIKVATVNGEIISLKRYRQVLADTQQRIGALKEYARMLGMSEALFLKNYYESINPHDVALDTTIREILVDQVKNPFNIHLASEYFKEELMRSIPQEIIDEEGRISLDSYQTYLSRLATTPAEYESSKEEEFKRQLIERFIMHSDYTPNYVIQDILEQRKAKKSFNIVVLHLERFLNEIQKNNLSEQELKAYYEENKELYRIPEKHKVAYWQVEPEQYAQAIEIDDASIQNFYEKNRTTFRIPPKIRVRHILLKNPTTQDQKELTKVLKTMQKVLEEVKQHPDKFASLAQQYSQDEATASKGGLTDFFKSGTFDSDFEKAAFRLQKNGEVSDIVKTEQGYEIIQLDERIKASEKPFDSVKQEITKTMKTKKALAKLKGDFEIMLHQARAGEKTIADFTKELSLEKKESDWLTRDDGEKKDTMGLIADFIFGIRKRQNRNGYFFNDGKYTVYQIIETKKSFIQEYDSVKSKVQETYTKKKAQSNLKSFAAEARSLIFNKKTTLIDFATKHNLKIIQSENIEIGGKIEGISDMGDLTQKIFTLTDPSQILYYRHENQSFLIQLKEQKASNLDVFESERLKIAKNEKFKNSTIHISAFIASLQKNAKIEVDKNVLKTYKGS